MVEKKGINRTIRYILTFILLIVVFLGVVYSSSILRTVPEHKKTIARIEKLQNQLVIDRNSARIGACIQDNNLRQAIRDSFHKSVESVRVAGAAPNPQLEEFIKNYEATVDNNIRDRDCSLPGIEEFLRSVTSTSGPTTTIDTRLSPPNS